MSKIKFQSLVHSLLVEVQAYWCVLEQSKATVPYANIESQETRAYLVVDKPSRYTRIGTGVLWHPRSQTRPESYRIDLVYYNIRRRGAKRDDIRSSGNKQDIVNGIGNSTRVGNIFKGRVGWKSRESGAGLLTVVIGESAQGLELVP